MPIYTFSTKTKRPQDTELVEKIKEECEAKGHNFSGLLVKLLREHDNARSK